MFTKERVVIFLAVLLLTGIQGIFSMMGIKIGADIAAEKGATLSQQFKDMGVVSGTLVISSTTVSPTVTVSGTGK